MIKLTNDDGKQLYNYYIRFAGGNWKQYAGSKIVKSFYGRFTTQEDVDKAFEHLHTTGFLHTYSADFKAIKR